MAEDDLVEPANVEVIAPDGSYETWRLRAEAETYPVRPTHLRRGRVTRLDTVPSTSLVRKSLSPPYARVPEERALLDFEITVGRRLLDHYGADAAPEEFPRLVGYQADVEEPFLLLANHRGTALSRAAGDIHDHRAFVVSLFRGLRLLHAIGVVHRTISPHSVRWDSRTRTAQIHDFAHAAFKGEPRRQAGAPPWSSAEQWQADDPGPGAGLAAESTTHPGDDIWSAGMLVYWLVSREQPPAEGPGPRELRFYRLEDLLKGVFDRRAAGRPSAEEVLLERLHAEDPWPLAVRPGDHRFVEGKRLFDEALGRKIGIQEPPAAVTGPVDGSGQGGPGGERAAGNTNGGDEEFLGGRGGTSYGGTQGWNTRNWTTWLRRSR